MACRAGRWEQYVAVTRIPETYRTAMVRASLVVGGLASAAYSASGVADLFDMVLRPVPRADVDFPGLVAFPAALSGYFAIALLRSVPSARPPWSVGKRRILRGFGRAWLVGV